MTSLSAQARAAIRSLRTARKHLQVAEADRRSGNERNAGIAWKRYREARRRAVQSALALTVECEIADRSDIAKHATKLASIAKKLPRKMS